LAKKKMRIESITKRFGSILAVDQVSARFEAGKVCVFAGPNGAGKTTLLRIIAGLERATSGSLDMEGIARREVGVVAQESYLYRDLTVLENLELYASLFDVSKDSIDYVTNLFDLSIFLNNPISILSHGQKQRVALARTLLPKPKVLLLDEPFLGLDTASVDKVQGFLNKFKMGGGLCLVAAHEKEFIKSIADTLLFLENGKLKYFGDWKE